MNLNNVFYFKNIVDKLYPDENRAPVDIQSVVKIVQASITSLPDEDFIEVMISCFIPDLYTGMGKREKLFTKLTELMVGEWWRRMGGTYRLPTKKSGTEDVELIYNNISIVCDAKVFRLGRSQKAPNVKDFLKLASVRLWINNLNELYTSRHDEHYVIGGLVTYSSLHEWESDSEVYEECTNHQTPVVMLPYEVLALLLNYKNNDSIFKLISIWNYQENNVETSREKTKYWDYITAKICMVANIKQSEYDRVIREYHKKILEAVEEYRKIVEDTVTETKLNVLKEMSQYKSIDDLRDYALKMIVDRDNATALDYLKHINDFRHF